MKKGLGGAVANAFYRARAELTRLINNKRSRFIAVNAVFAFVTLCVGLYFWIHNAWMTAIIGIVAEAILVTMYLLFTSKFDALIGNTLGAVSIIERYDNFLLGIFDVSALVYYISVSFLFVFMTIQRIKKKRYN